jgi:hypothetical protein
MYTSFTQKKSIVITFCVGLCIVLFAVASYIEVSREKYTYATQHALTLQKQLLEETLSLLQNEKASPEVAQILVDCELASRVRFDEQLGKLSELKGQQLVEIEQLFTACGNYFAQQNAIMVLFLEKEFLVYQQLVTLLETYELEKWQQIVAREKKKSALSLELVAIQGDIISGLRNNLSLSSDEIQALSVAGQQTRDALLSLTSLIIKTDTETEAP